MTSPSSYTIIIGEGVKYRAGDDWNIVIPLEDETGGPLAWPVGATARMHLRSRPADPAVLLSLGSSAGQLVLEPGALRIVVDDLVTAAVPVGVHVFDVEITVAGVRDTFIDGSFMVAQKITRGP